MHASRLADMLMRVAGDELAAGVPSLTARTIWQNSNDGANRLRAYLTRVYRESKPFYSRSASELHHIVANLAWVYNSATGSAVTVSCQHSFIGWQRRMCDPGNHGHQYSNHSTTLQRTTLERTTLQPAALQHTAALHFEPPLVASLSFSDYGFFLPRGMPHACNPALSKPPTVPDEAWVEVLRLGGDQPAGKPRAGDGCWFLVAKGSGVFVHTGRSLRAASRKRLAGALHLSGPYLQHPYTLEMEHPLCAHARAAGYDSVQLWDETCGDRILQGRPLKPNATLPGAACVHELLICHDTCMRPNPIHERAKQDTCAPGLPLRSGLNATLPCECHVSSAYRMINCHGTGISADSGLGSDLRHAVVGRGHPNRTTERKPQCHSHSR